MTKQILVCGAGGFIGNHLVNKLVDQGHQVIAVDLKYPEYNLTKATDFYRHDLTDISFVQNIFNEYKFDEVYQLAADMGGAGYIFTGENDANIMYNSTTINLNILYTLSNIRQKPKIFYSSSACVYNQNTQTDPNNPDCRECTAYPSEPDSCYGWEKLYSEQLYKAFEKNKGIPVRIARFHNIMGPLGSWNNGKEKAPAAICRKIAEVEDGGTIDIWGDGEQTRSFLHIDECLDGVERLMQSNCLSVINIGSEEMVTINQLVEMIAKIANKTIHIKHISGPQGVRGRCSNNDLIYEKLGWKPNYPLIDGLQILYPWINQQVHQ